MPRSLFPRPTVHLSHFLQKHCDHVLPRRVAGARNWPSSVAQFLGCACDCGTLMGAAVGPVGVFPRYCSHMCESGMPKQSGGVRCWHACVA